jgi:hypothetical protein
MHMCPSRGAVFESVESLLNCQQQEKKNKVYRLRLRPPAHTKTVVMCLGACLRNTQENKCHQSASPLVPPLYVFAIMDPRLHV